MIENFDYKEFAQNMKEQCIELVPKEFCKKDKEFIINTVYNFCYMAGEAISNDPTVSINDEQCAIIAQAIAKWTFHKSIDIIRSGIKPQFREGILQNIAFAIFEVAKCEMKKNTPLDNIIDIVEWCVNKTYKEALEELKNKGSLTEKQVKEALSQSNIDEFSQKVAKKEISDNNKQQIKPKKHLNTALVNLCSCLNTEAKKYIEKLHKIAIIFFSNFSTQLIILLIIALLVLSITKPSFSILADITFYSLITTLSATAFLSVFNFFVDINNKFYKKVNQLCSWVCSTAVFIFVSIFCYTQIAENIILINPFLFCLTVSLSLILIAKIWLDIDVNESLEKINSLENEMKNLVNPDRMYERLGIDVISILLGEGLLSIADPDVEGELLAKSAALRQRLTDTLGYIIPSVRVMDSGNLDEYEYRINIRNNEIASGFVYPGKYMVTADEWDSNNQELPDDAIVGVESTYHVQCYWLKEKYIKNKKNITVVKPEDVIISHLEKLAIDNVDSILSTTDILKYLELCESTQDYVISNLRERLTAEDIRKIFVNLIKEKVPVRDITLLFDRLNDFSRFSTSPDVLSEQLRKVFARKICLDNCTIDKVIYTVSISEKFEKILSKSIVETQQKTILNLSTNFIQEFVEKIAVALMDTNKSVGKQAVITCSSNIRLPLYRFLNKHIPTVVVLSYDELVDDIKVETAGQIE